MIRLAFALIAFFICSGASASDKTAQIIDQVSQAAGGRAAAEAIPALVYDLHIKEATYEADGTYVVDRKGRMRIDIRVGGKRVFTECHDGKTAWEMDAKGVAKKTSDSGRAALWHGTQYPGQILDISELRARGHRVAYAGHETVGDIDYDVLSLTLSDGFTTFRYVDPHTHLIARGRDFRAPHPDIDPTKITVETTWSDFRPVDGVMRPFVSVETNLANGQWLQTATATSIRKVAALPDSLFAFGAPAQDLTETSANH